MVVADSSTGRCRHRLLYHFTTRLNSRLSDAGTRETLCEVHSTRSGLSSSPRHAFRDAVRTRLRYACCALSFGPSDPMIRGAWDGRRLDKGTGVTGKTVTRSYGLSCRISSASFVAKVRLLVCFGSSDMLPRRRTLRRGQSGSRRHMRLTTPEHEARPSSETEGLIAVAGPGKWVMSNDCLPDAMLWRREIRSALHPAKLANTCPPSTGAWVG